MAYSYQQFGSGQVYTSGQAQQTEDSMRDHDHTGGAGAPITLAIFQKRSENLILGSSGETIPCSFTVAGGTIGPNNLLRTRVFLLTTSTQWSGSTNLDVILRYGSTDMATATINPRASANARWSVEGIIMGANSATNEQEGHLHIIANQNDAATVFKVHSATDPVYVGGVASEDSTADLGFSIVFDGDLRTNTGRQMVSRYFIAENLG